MLNKQTIRQLQLRFTIRMLVIILRKRTRLSFTKGCLVAQTGLMA